MGEEADEHESEKEGPVSEGTQERRAAGRAAEDYSYGDGNATTAENDKGPKGPLAALLGLDILPSPQSETTTMESGDSEDRYGPGGGGQG